MAREGERDRATGREEAWVRLGRRRWRSYPLGDWGSTWHETDMSDVGVDVVENHAATRKQAKKSCRGWRIREQVGWNCLQKSSQKRSFWVHVVRQVDGVVYGTVGSFLSWVGDSDELFPSYNIAQFLSKWSSFFWFSRTSCLVEMECSMLLYILFLFQRIQDKYLKNAYVSILLMQNAIRIDS